MEPEREWGMEAVVAELRADARHLTSDVGALRQDVHRVDGRVFQMLLIQLATLGTALGSLVAAVAG